MRQIRLSCVLAIAVGCDGSPERPELTSITCNPGQLSVASAPPYRVTCGTMYEGKVGDVSGSSVDSSFTLWSTARLVGEPSAGSFSVVFTNERAPRLGALEISVTADHPDGIDGPGDDAIETQIEVVP